MLHALPCCRHARMHDEDSACVNSLLQGLISPAVNLCTSTDDECYITFALQEASVMLVPEHTLPMKGSSTWHIEKGRPRRSGKADRWR